MLNIFIYESYILMVLISCYKLQSGAGYFAMLDVGRIASAKHWSICLKQEKNTCRDSRSF